MNGFARAFGTVVLSVVALLVAFSGIGWAVTRYIDDNFGGGTSGLVFAVMVGMALTVLIYTLSGFQNNQTHRSAGEDITDFAANMSKAQTAQWQVQREWARQDREVAALSMRGALEDKKAEQRRGDFVWRQQQRQQAEARKREEARQAEAAEWAWVDEEDTADAPIFFE